MARVSTQEQGGDHQSIPAQMAAMRARCEREGWEIVREDIAEGESGATADLKKRPVLKAIVEAAERREFDVLLCHESSRLARNVRLQSEVLDRLESAGVRFINLQLDIDYRTADGRFVGDMTGVINAQYSRKLSEHIRKAHRELAQRGLVAGTIPFGYVRPSAPDGQRSAAVVPVIVPDEAEAIRWAYEHYQCTGGYLDIVREWNRRGLQPRSRRGHTQWVISSVQRILENPWYAGWIERFDPRDSKLPRSQRRVERIEAAHEAIVDRDLWMAVQERRRKGHRAARTGELLSGIVRCVACRVALYTEWSAAGLYYREPRSNKTALAMHACQPRPKGFPGAVAHEQIEQVIASMGYDPAWIAEAERQARRGVKQETQSAGQRAELEDRRRRLMDLYQLGDIGPDEYRQKRAAIQAEIAAIPAPVEAITFAGRKFTSLAEVWAVADTSQRRRVLQEILESVEVDAVDREVFVRPRAEYAELFEARRQFITTTNGGFGTPGRSRALQGHHGVYGRRELVA